MTNTTMITYELAYEMVFDFYEAAGFRSDVLKEELNSKSETEIIEMYMKL